MFTRLRSRRNRHPARQPAESKNPRSPSVMPKTKRKKNRKQTSQSARRVQHHIRQIDLTSGWSALNNSRVARLLPAHLNDAPGFGARNQSVRTAGHFSIMSRFLSASRRKKSGMTAGALQKTGGTGYIPFILDFRFKRRYRAGITITTLEKDYGHPEEE